MTNVTPLNPSNHKTPFEAFGIECKAGWRGLYEPLIELCKSHGYTVVQVKEKFGGLRFDVMDGDGTLDVLISAAENASYETCEDCGKREVRYDPQLRESISVVTTSKGNRHWIRSLCPPCREKWEAQP